MGRLDAENVSGIGGAGGDHHRTRENTKLYRMLWLLGKDAGAVCAEGRLQQDGREDGARRLDNYREQMRLRDLCPLCEKCFGQEPSLYTSLFYKTRRRDPSQGQISGQAADFRIFLWRLYGRGKGNGSQDGKGKCIEFQWNPCAYFFCRKQGRN